MDKKKLQDICQRMSQAVATQFSRHHRRNVEVAAWILEQEK